MEVSITLAALLIMTAFCINLVLNSAKTSLIDALQMLHIELICLQQQAISCNLLSSLTFLPERNAYQITQTEKTIIHELPKSITFGFISGIKGPPSKPINLIKQPIRFENPHPLAAIIQPNGRISSGTVYLKHSSGSVMGAITITPHQIAYVRVYVLENKNTWKLLAT
jgi:hypothetical protein